MITRIDRLARSIKDLQDIVATLQQRGATLMATEEPMGIGVVKFFDVSGGRFGSGMDKTAGPRNFRRVPTSGRESPSSVCEPTGAVVTAENLGSSLLAKRSPTPVPRCPGLRVQRP
ncbi:MAG: recombinase family protein [Thiocapsa sp.]|uniref:recombinase family protein n=1 Tax=Thiocapsa sp. TaxID=2024551 RepID=UPI001BD01B76|nr:MAG: recombinase family protein [Thiocapsa sp.]